MPRQAMAEPRFVRMARDRRLTCPSQKLHPAIVPAGQTHVALGDDRENGRKEAENFARFRLLCGHTQTSLDEPVRQGDVYDHAAREYR